MTTGGNIPFSLDRGVSITLTEGAITAWTISVTGLCIGFSIGTHSCHLSNSSADILLTARGRRPHPADQPLRPLQRHSRATRHLVPTQRLTIAGVVFLYWWRRRQKTA
jgi:hypothetical protein